MSKTKYPFTFEEFKAIYSKVPRLCVELVIFHKGSLLLVLRKKHGYENTWHLPGGTLYYGESVHEGVLRVAREEAGLNVKIKKLLGYIEYPSERLERGFGTTVSLVFLATTVNSSKPRPMFEEQADFFPKLPENSIPEQRAFLLGTINFV